MYSKTLLCLLFGLFLTEGFAQLKPELVTQEKNLGTITKIVYSPNGRYVASANEKDFTIRLWDIQSDKMLGSLHGHEQSIDELYFHSSGEQLYSFGSDDKNYIWDLNTWTMKDSIEFPVKVSKLKMLEEGKKVFFKSEKNELYVYDISTKVSEIFLSKQKTQMTDFHSAGGQLFVGFYDGTVQIFDMATKKSKKKLEGSQAVQYLFCDGTYLVVGYSGNTKLYSLSDYSVKSDFISTTEKVVDFNSKLKRMAFPGQEKQVIVMDYENGKKLTTLSSENGNAIKSVSMSPDGLAVAVSGFKKMQLGKKTSQSNVIQIWDITHQKIVHTLKGDVEGLDAFAFGQTENRLYLLRGQDFHIWNMNSSERIGSTTLHERKIEMKAHASDAAEEKKDEVKEKVNETTGNDIMGIANGGLGSLKDRAKNKLNDTKTTAVQESKELGKAAFTRLGFQENKIIVSKTGKYLVTALKGDEIRLYEFVNGLPKHIDFIRTKQKEFYDLVIDPNEKFIVVGGNGDEPISIIPLDSTRYAQKLDVNDAENRKLGGVFQTANALAFTNDGTKLVAVFNNGRIVVWNTDGWYKLTDFRMKVAMTMKPFGGFSKDGKKFFINTSSGVFTYDFSIYETAQSGKQITPADALGVKKTPIEGFPVMTHVALDHVVSVTKTKVNFLQVATGSTMSTGPINAKLINDIQVSKFGYAGISLRNGELRIYDPSTGKERFIMVESDDNAIFKTPENYYKITKEGQDLVTFRVGKDAYPFEQFDAKYNRPDIVLQAMNSEDEGLIRLYKSAYEKRLSKLGLSESDLDFSNNMPSLEIKNISDIPLSTDDSKLSFSIFASDKNYDLKKVSIWINDVPIYGKNGIPVTGKNFEKVVEIDLAAGINKIQISCDNVKGSESLKQTVEVECNRKVKPNLYILTIGTSNYKDKKFNLNYAAKDALDMAEVFSKNTNGVYGSVKTKTITNEQATKLTIEKVKEFFNDGTIDDVVLVFIAGHGVLDANFDYYYGTHDIDFTKPSLKGLTYQSLEAILDGIKPLKKMMFMDTCHSGEIEKEEVIVDTEVKKSDKVKFRDVGPGIKNTDGVSPSKVMKELFNDLRRGTGTTVISSAGGVELAMESDDWKNGLFTYSLLSGIKNSSADLNKDGSIMLSELQLFVTDEVTRLSGGQQIPTTRIQNLSLDYRVW